MLVTSQIFRKLKIYRKFLCTYIYFSEVYFTICYSVLKPILFHDSICSTCEKGKAYFVTSDKRQSFKTLNPGLGQSHTRGQSDPILRYIYGLQLLFYLYFLLSYFFSKLRILYCYTEIWFIHKLQRFCLRLFLLLEYSIRTWPGFVTNQNITSEIELGLVIKKIFY